MTEGLLIVGAGGHGKVVADAAMESGRWSRIAFVDDRSDAAPNMAGLRVLARVEELPLLRSDWADAVVAIGAAPRRLELLDVLRVAGYGLPVIRHPSAAVSRWAEVGHGTVVFAQAAVNVGAVVGAGCIVNTGATVDHDCVLGDGVHVCPGAHIAGNVRVGARSWIGIGAVVRQGLTIGSDAMIGAGSVVVNAVAAGATVMGVPARARGDGG